MRGKIGHLCKDELWTDLLKEETHRTDETLLERLMKEYQETDNEPAQSYDIENLDELILWRDGHTIHPRIGKKIMNVTHFIQENIEEHADQFEQFHNMNDREKICDLMTHNRFFYLRRSSWDFIIQHVHDSHVMNSVFGIFSIKADEMNTNKLCKALLNNTDLLKSYVIQSLQARDQCTE